MPVSASSPIRLATRGSALALAQANQVLSLCRSAHPDLLFELKIVKTTGDKLQTASLAEAALPKGLFTKELEAALMAREADLAVHSLKDLPTELPESLILGAVLPRADVRDVVIYRDLERMVANAEPRLESGGPGRAYRPHLSLRALPYRAVVATSSTRRAAQALEARPDLVIVPIRGNVGTRLRKIAEQSGTDATLLAVAGLQRLHFQIETHGALTGPDVPAGLAATPIEISEMLPCVGQAAIGIEIRRDDSVLAPICTRLNHGVTWDCVTAERSFLRAMGGGCQIAVAALATISENRMRLQGVSFLSGNPRRGEQVGPAEDAVKLGEELARALKPD